jgi:pyruvate/2-oxoglutarate dehydrogenase complex dihydrolipoamide acyltransferase (E2) component
VTGDDDHVWVAMPSVEVGMVEGTIVQLHVAVGDAVTVGQVLFTVEAEKVTLEIESSAAGRVSAVAVAEGDVVAVGGQVLRVDRVEGGDQ